ncbi:hypothetical protein [Nocardia terpenica]|uniref:Uncharacterized protein n=1 Tax=Nocardia terpenica TaxID=455432 RepID=A0A6G9ZDT3_9NOCA|nr:hypothetical protein [Nocardia terpenica]QIS23604.1 hypothetical protein F6W96_40400 [Nocardia terpenica]
MCTTHHTEVEGLRAEWKFLAGHRIGIVSVRAIADGEPVVCFPENCYPDLALARERRPELETLWNAIRHDYWTEALRGVIEPGH